MKKILLICLILTATFLQSCDERITPLSNNSGGGGTNTSKTKTDILTANPWQADEVSIKGGGKTILIFSKSKAIGLKTEYADSKTTYRADGTTEQVEKGFTEKGTWKFLSNESQLQIKPEQGEVQLYIIDLLNETNFNVRVTFKKVDFGNDDNWKGYLELLGLPTTLDSFEIEVKSIPAK
jgi:hypothetical protein